MKWVTREDAKVDRIACSWLIRRFVAPNAEFLHVPAREVNAVADREGAIPYDVAEDLHKVPEGPGLRAISHRFSLVLGTDDAKKIGLEMPLYDASYSWCRRQVETASPAR